MAGGGARAPGSCLRKCRGAASDIACLAISGQSLGVVPVDGAGRLLRERTPIWSDTRASRQTAAFFEKVDRERWYMTTGNGFPAECYAVFKIMWYRDNEPDMFSRVKAVLGSKDYINLTLTGRIAPTSPTPRAAAPTASGTGPTPRSSCGPAGCPRRSSPRSCPPRGSSAP